MKFDALFTEKPCVFAIEVFPPKRHMGVETVYGTLQAMSEVPVDYISVTYSAGGTGAKEYTAAIARYLKEVLQVEPLAHLTCMGAAREDIDRAVGELQEAGVENVLALRGDRDPSGPMSSDFFHASDLMRAIGARSDFYIAGACYPEGHPESPSLLQDIDMLKAKEQAGAGHFVSQLFFDNGRFFRFLCLARKQGIRRPIEAGVMPIVRPEQVARTLALSSASVPADFRALIDRFEDDPASFYEAGIDYAIRQCRDLIAHGVDGIHLYAMNKPDVARRVREGIADLL